MQTEISLSKRIKRQVIGRTRSFFIACPPGFETLCEKELASLALNVQQVSVIPGGVEFKLLVGKLLLQFTPNRTYLQNFMNPSLNKTCDPIHGTMITGARSATKGIRLSQDTSLGLVIALY